MMKSIFVIVGLRFHTGEHSSVIRTQVDCMDFKESSELILHKIYNKIHIKVAVHFPFSQENQFQSVNDQAPR